MAKFTLGNVVTTAGIHGMMEDDKEFGHFVQKSIGRYYECDWGDTNEEDKHLNDCSVQSRERILAVYTYNKDGVETPIWIITEADRSYTTILFPHEY